VVEPCEYAGHSLTASNRWPVAAGRASSRRRVGRGQMAWVTGLIAIRRDTLKELTNHCAE
jgi:hypothetical protein